MLCPRRAFSGDAFITTLSTYPAHFAPAWNDPEVDHERFSRHSWQGTRNVSSKRRSRAGSGTARAARCGGRSARHLRAQLERPRSLVTLLCRFFIFTISLLEIRGPSRPSFFVL